MKKFIANRELLKDSFQAVAYFVFIAGFIKLAKPFVAEQAFLYKLGFVFVFLLLTVFSLLFVMLHVCGKITQLYHKDFKIPFIDDDYKPPTLKEFFSRKDFRMWLLLGSPIYLLGSQIVYLGLV